MLPGSDLIPTSQTFPDLPAVPPRAYSFEAYDTYLGDEAAARGATLPATGWGVVELLVIQTGAPSVPAYMHDLLGTSRAVRLFGLAGCGLLFTACVGSASDAVKVPPANSAVAEPAVQRQAQPSDDAEGPGAKAAEYEMPKLPEKGKRMMVDEYCVAFALAYCDSLDEERDDCIRLLNGLLEDAKVDPLQCGAAGSDLQRVIMAVGEDMAPLARDAVLGAFADTAVPPKMKAKFRQLIAPHPGTLPEGIASDYSLVAVKARLEANEAG